MIEGRLILPVLIAEQADQIRLLRALLAVGQLEQVAQRYGRSEEIAVEIDEREQRTDLARIAEPRIRITGELLDRIVLTLREHACTLVGTRVQDHRSTKHDRIDERDICQSGILFAQLGLILAHGYAGVGACLHLTVYPVLAAHDTLFHHTVQRKDRIVEIRIQQHIAVHAHLLFRTGRNHGETLMHLPVIVQLVYELQQLRLVIEIRRLDFLTLEDTQHAKQLDDFKRRFTAALALQGIYIEIFVKILQILDISAHKIRKGG